ncbi:MAG: hypothetical protein JNL44_04130 [Gemmatimonadetes bacterium]|nr:hypothetical protein [Gemmatimonadota bacterium]
MSENIVEKSQQDLCFLYGANYLPVKPLEKIGISKSVRAGRSRINGLRHPPVGDTSGWYVWAGEEPSSESDFFQPLHIAHLSECCPQIIKFLGLAPGWRFLIEDDYEDVWYDEKLLLAE